MRHLFGTSSRLKKVKRIHQAKDPSVVILAIGWQVSWF
jgi:hypothetical protein